ncbi:MAG TPA: AbrB/MazE/SpoVT family DNA-binding domain-containing protein [Candidatus Paceibacterota bacterium]|nr:AbrB/MazE/SpoVT family DNA-binding domain-containing protein [Candidatus Paceibacterota bacterium]
MEVKTKAKKWGSSIGIILPKAVVEAKKIRENDEIIIEIKNRPLAGELFGKFPEWKSGKSAQEIKDEMRRGWGI